jgi:hypothetical protein
VPHHFRFCARQLGALANGPIVPATVQYVLQSMPLRPTAINLAGESVEGTTRTFTASPTPDFGRPAGGQLAPPEPCKALGALPRPAGARASLSPSSSRVPLSVPPDERCRGTLDGVQAAARKHLHSDLRREDDLARPQALGRRHITYAERQQEDRCETPNCRRPHRRCVHRYLIGPVEAPTFTAQTAAPTG